MVTYATPTTYDEFIDLIDGIDEWPADCNQQAGAFYDLIDRIKALELGWESLQPITLHVVQDSQPNLNDWQTAWEKAGYILPITGNVYGLHESQTLSTREVGEYVWYEGTMRPMHARYWLGSSEIKTPFLPDPADGGATGTVANGAAEQKRFEFPAVMKTAGWLLFQMGFNASISPTLGLEWRTNFEATNATYRQINGQNVIGRYAYVQYFPRSRQSSPYVGNVEMWFRSNNGGSTVNTSEMLKFLNTIPGWMEMLYD